MQEASRSTGTGGLERDDGAAVVPLAAAVAGVSPEDLTAIRTRVLNVVGHELRTPVTTLRGLADALSTVDAATAQQHVIPAIQRSAERLERLVDDLLIANGIVTALPVGRPAAVDVAAAVRTTWAELGGEPAELGIDVADEGVVLVLGQPSAVTGALERVLENARLLGDEPPTVRIRREGPVVTIEVDSPGPALDAEEVRLATELLFRGHAAVMRAPGLGLGLPVAKALIEHVGGALAVAGREGGGLITILSAPASDDG
jgi:signal transduction histidine kinase